VNTEIEVKFINVSIDDVRSRLKRANAKLAHPMTDMKRAIIDHEDLRLKNEKDAFIRVRDEGERVMLTFKQFETRGFGDAKEYETEVGDFDTTVKIFEAAGLIVKSYQESRRETWELEGAEIMIDEWPWLNPYIEIEGDSKEKVRSIASKLGFDWGEAVFGSVMEAYRLQYPHNKKGDGSIGSIKSVKFGDPLPDIFVVK
jgi:adenylate cyclase class 2